jgi:hypothetical protein
LIYPIELRDGRPTGMASRNTYAASITLSQVINTRFQMMVQLDPTYQQGFLGLPFNRVYFNDNSETIESLPESRFKIPIGIRGNYFVGDRLIVRALYRYYWDDWNLKGHTIELETAVKITPFISVTPFYRYYTQSAVKYFAPYAIHDKSATFYTCHDGIWSKLDMAITNDKPDWFRTLFPSIADSRSSLRQTPNLFISKVTHPPFFLVPCFKAIPIYTEWIKKNDNHYPNQVHYP